MSVKNARTLTAVLGIVGLVIMLLSSYIGESIFIIGAVILFSSLIPFWLFNRCPYCGKFLGRDGGDYCQHCGKELD